MLLMIQIKEVLLKKMSEEENKDCPCPETECVRHGKCSECQEYHPARDEKSFCGK